MKILKVIIKKEWYDLIKSGEKTIEYRDYSDFWISRLENKNGSFRHYDLIEFKNDVTGLNIIFAEQMDFVLQQVLARDPFKIKKRSMKRKKIISKKK